MKISIVYVSQTGNTEMAAESVQDGIMVKYPFIQVKIMDIRENEVDLEFLEQSDAVIFGSPVYFTSMSWELKKWFDQSFRVNLKGKLGAAFVTAQSPAGGTDTAIMEILRHMLMKGMYVFSGAGEKAARSFQIGAVGIAKEIDDCAEQFEQFGASVAQAAIQLFVK
ncbi:MAG: flavodoxin family protein [Lachnospiraceae bacterium]